MNRDEVFHKVCTLVAETLHVDADSLTEQSNLKDLGADSFDLLDLVCTIEDAFELELNDDAVAQVETIEDVVNGIVAQKNVG